MKRKPVVLMYDSELMQDEVSAIEYAWNQIRKVYPGRYYLNMKNRRLDSDKYGYADEFVRRAQRVQCADGAIQLDSTDIARQMYYDRLQEDMPSICILFTARDLTYFDQKANQWLNFCFGTAIPEWHMIVQSVFRFRKLDRWHKYWSLQALMWHELGHVFGLAHDLRRSNTEEKYGAHCTNPGCLMRQNVTVDTWAQNAELAFHNGRVYCPQCALEAYHTRI